MSKFTAKMASIVFLFGIAWAAVIGGADSLPPRGCTGALSASGFDYFQTPETALQRFKAFAIKQASDQNGFVILSPELATSLISETVHVKFPQMPRPELWEYNRERFYFLDVGFKGAQDFSAQLNREVVEHIRHSPQRNLRLVFDAEDGAAREQLELYRWTFHERVLLEYEATKGYLSPSDLAILRTLNFNSMNSDVFGLMDSAWDVGAPDLALNYIAKHLVTTIQVSYFGDRHFFAPSARGMLDYLHLHVDESEDQFPYEYRLAKKHKAQFRESVRSRFPFRTACEVTRWGKFDTVPEPIQQLFLYRAISAARSRKVKTILAAGDLRSTRLFKRYGFKLFSQLPVEQSDMPEFLSYLETDSPEFETVFKKLAEHGTQVGVLGELTGGLIRPK